VLGQKGCCAVYRCNADTQLMVETVLPVCGIYNSCLVCRCHAVTANDEITTIHQTLDVWGLGCQDYYAKRDPRLYCSVLTESGSRSARRPGESLGEQGEGLGPVLCGSALIILCCILDF
jgi:hypothetical protein